MVHSPGFEPGTLQIYSLLPLTARPTVDDIIKDEKYNFSQVFENFVNN